MNRKTLSQKEHRRLLESLQYEWKKCLEDRAVIETHMGWLMKEAEKLDERKPVKKKAKKK
jgi:hypothetical protein